MDLTIRVAREEEWQRVRDLRLRALRSDPRAFGAYLHEEEHQPEAFWRGRLADPRATTFLAGDRLGLCTLLAVEGEGERAELVGMWVAPEARGVGVGGALIEAALAHARERKLSRVGLWVNVEMTGAMRLYERAGFEPVGDAVPGTRDATRTYQRMARALS